MVLLILSHLAEHAPASASAAAGGEPIGQSVNRSLFSRNPYKRRLVAKNTSTACLLGRDFCTSACCAAAERPSSAGSRRKAISRKIASCFGRWPPSRPTLAIAALPSPDLRPPAAVSPRVADRLRFPRKPLVGRVAGEDVLPLELRLLRQICRRGLQNPSQRFQPTAKFQRAKKTLPPGALGDFDRPFDFFVPVHGRLEPVFQRQRMRRDQHGQRFHRVEGPVGWLRIAEHLAEQVHGRPRRDVPLAYRWSARPIWNSHSEPCRM